MEYVVAQLHLKVPWFATHTYRTQVSDVFAVFSVLGMSLPVPLMIEDHHHHCVELRYVVLYGIAWLRSRRSKVHVL